MSSDTYDASAKFCQSFGTSLSAAELAISHEPGAKLIFDHAVAFIASFYPSKGTVDPDTAYKIFEAGFGYGTDWSQGPYGSRGLPHNLNQAKEAAWELFRQNIPPGPAEPKDHARPLKDMTAPGLLPGKEPSVGSLDTWFNKGMKARDDKTQCPYAPNSVAAYMHVKGWVFRDIQIIACRFCSSYAREQIASGNITQEQIDDYAANGRQK